MCIRDSYIAPGAFYSGRVLLADIGVHPMLGALTFETNCFLWDKESSLDVLPEDVYKRQQFKKALCPCEKND